MRYAVEQTEGLDPGEIRGLHNALVLPTLARGLVHTHNVDAGGVPGEWFIPRRVLPSARSSAPGRSGVVLYLHGGGYVVCSNRTHADFMSRIAHATSGRVLGIDYRLAPEHPFPAALEDTLAAYEWLLRSERPESIVIAGDSAGGGLALALLMLVRDRGLPLPAGAALLSPWVRLRTASPSTWSNLRYDWATSAIAVERWRAWYLCGQDRIPVEEPPRSTPLGPATHENPLVSPILGELRGLPPLLVHVGGAELLHDDVVEFCRRMREAGGEVELEVWPDMVHNFQMFVQYTGEARRAIRKVAAYIRGCWRS
jgi:epsilon-lactone hydrolase